MNLLLSLLAELLHVGLMVVTAPVLVGAMDWLTARLSGRAGPSVLAPGRDLIRLFRKQPITQDNLSVVFQIAPVLGLGVMLATSTLVPSFAVGMALGPLADLLVIIALLIGERIILALAAFDMGAAESGLWAQDSARLAILSDAAIILSMMALGVMANGFNVDQIIQQQHEGLLLPIGASATAFASLLAVLLAQAAAGRPRLESIFNGPDLALVQYAGWLRRLIWIDLLGALFLPIGMATAESGPRGWIIGLAAWLLKLFLFLFCASAMQTALGRIPRRSLPDLIGVSALLALFAVIIVLTTASAV
jgi:formate hydrogenlyase subunit 4